MSVFLLTNHMLSQCRKLLKQESEALKVMISFGSWSSLWNNDGISFIVGNSDVGHKIKGIYISY